MFSFYKSKNAYPIASTNKNRTVYFIQDFNVNEEKIKEEILEEKNISDINEIKNILQNKVLFTSLTLDKDEEFFPIPETDNNKRIALSVIGNSGSGKSHFISKFIKKYEKINKDYEQFLLTNKQKDEDPAFEKLENLQYIPINSLNEPITIKRFENSIFVFDDIHEGVILDTESDFVKSLEKESYIKQEKIIKSRQKQLDEIINRSSINMLSLGRSRKISIIIVKHQFKDGKSSIYKTENTHLCVFPSGNTNKIREYYKDVEGLSKDQIKKCLNLTQSKGRYQFLYTSRTGLRYCISNKNIISLDFEE
jgi:hypothetical protein